MTINGDLRTRNLAQRPLRGLARRVYADLTAELSELRTLSAELRMVAAAAWAEAAELADMAEDFAGRAALIEATRQAMANKAA